MTDQLLLHFSIAWVYLKYKCVDLFPGPLSVKYVTSEVCKNKKGVQIILLSLCFLAVLFFSAEFALICYRIQFSGKKHENEVLLKTGFAATLCLQKKSIRREHFTQSLKREGQFAKFRTKGQLAKLLCWTYVWLATVRLHKLGPAIIKIAITKKQFLRHMFQNWKCKEGQKAISLP